jgi:hypothetical protein
MIRQRERESGRLTAVDLEKAAGDGGARIGATRTKSDLHDLRKAEDEKRPDGETAHGDKQQTPARSRASRDSSRRSAWKSGVQS